MKIFSTLRGLLDDRTGQQSNGFHKNLFQENEFQYDTDEGDDTSSESSESDNEYSSDSEEESTNCSPVTSSSHSAKKSNVYKLKNLPVPLTETIAEVLQEFSHDKFLVDDIAFIFEMSRKRAISPYALVVALIYLNRLKTKTSCRGSRYPTAFSSCTSSNADSFDKYSVNYLTNTELCLVSLLLASKYLIDEGEVEEIYNDDWALASELPVKEINKLEKSFLRQMDWDLYVSSEEFWEFTSQLTEKTTRKKIQLQFDQCTYTDLDVLLNSKEFSLEMTRKYLDLLTKLIIICSSTIVYVTLSSFFVSAYVYFLKNQLLATTSLLSTQDRHTCQTQIKTNLTTEPIRKSRLNQRWSQGMNDLQSELEATLEKQTNVTREGASTDTDVECMGFFYKPDKKSNSPISVSNLLRYNKNFLIEPQKHLNQKEPIKFKSNQILTKFFL